MPRRGSGPGGGSFDNVLKASKAAWLFRVVAVVCVCGAFYGLLSVFYALVSDHPLSYRPGAIMRQREEHSNSHLSPSQKTHYSRLEAINEDEAPDEIQVLEEFLPREALHESPAACRHGPFIYLVGGRPPPTSSGASGNASAPTAAPAPETPFHTLNLDTLTVSKGPPAPIPVLPGAACAVSADGVLHLTGGYRDGAAEGEPTAEGARASHWMLDTRLPTKTAAWQLRADLPAARGGHACTFLKDGHMYCVGGGVGPLGPFVADLSIYDTLADVWKQGAPMKMGRDMAAVVPTHGGGRLYVLGGRTDRSRRPSAAPSPRFWETTRAAELYDPARDAWQHAPGLPTPKARTLVTHLQRHPTGEPNLIVVGGEVLGPESGFALASVEEFDVDKGLWYCHPPLPHEASGGLVAAAGGSLFVVGGAEASGKATRRMQIMGLSRMPNPEQCAYFPQHMGQSQLGQEQLAAAAADETGSTVVADSTELDAPNG